MYGIVCLFWTSLSFSLTLILDLISFEILSVSFQWQFKRNLQFLNVFFVYWKYVAWYNSVKRPMWCPLYWCLLILFLSGSASFTRCHLKVPRYVRSMVFYWLKNKKINLYLYISLEPRIRIFLSHKPVISRTASDYFPSIHYIVAEKSRIISFLFITPLYGVTSLINLSLVPRKRYR